MRIAIMVDPLFFMMSRGESCVNKNSMSRKLAMAGILTALAVVGSLISFPIAGSRCAPVQHMINVFAAVMLGPFWGVGIAFCASLLRNLLGLGTLMAFPGSMVGALCCGIVFSIMKKMTFKVRLAFTCTAEAFGTGVLGGIAAYPIAKLLMGLNPEGMFVYIIPFLISTVAGSILAYVIILQLNRNGAFRKLYLCSSTRK